MPLDRATTTRASWIMLPAHAALSLYLGHDFLTAPTSASSGLRAIASEWSLRDSGFILLALGTLELLALFVFKGRSQYAIPLGAGCLAYLGLAVMAGLNHEPGTSTGGVAVWTYIALAHLASLVSLAFYEGSEVDW